MGNSYNGSKKPLNHKPIVLPESTEKSLSWQEKVEKFYRGGSPITKSGDFNGAKSNLHPKVPKELNPPILVKALGGNTTPKPGAAGPQYGRKRDEHGRFSETQSAGSESAAHEDLANAERDQREAERQMGIVHEKREKKPFISKNFNSSIGSSPLDMPMPQQSQMDQPVASTMSGMPVYDDPFHQEHQGFGPNEHNEAANIREQMSMDAAGSGDQMGAMQHSQAAEAHRDLANDSMSPMERKVDQMPGQQMSPPSFGQQPQSPPMDFDSQQQSSPPPQQEQPPMNFGDDTEEPSMEEGSPEEQPEEEESQNPFKKGIDDGARKFDNFLDVNRKFQNKPLMPPANPGPSPGMVNSQTAQPTGPQTTMNNQFAGTVQERQPEPNDFSYPPDANNPMPMGGASGLDALRRLQGMATEQEDPNQMQTMTPPMMPNKTVGDSILNAENNRQNAPAFKSLSKWLSKRK